MLIKKAKYIKDFIIEATFDNGAVKHNDFRKWLFSDINPMHYKFRKPKNFRMVKAEYGMIVIGNDEMEFPDYHIHDLEIIDYKKGMNASGKNKKTLNLT